jgi:hypothetical protein
MRYIQIKTDDGYEMVPADDFVRPPRKAPYVWSDLKAYRPVAGPEAVPFMRGDRKNCRPIDGRKQHRDFLRRNDFVEVGDQFAPSTLLKTNGKTQENYDRTHNRKHKGHDVTAMAAGMETTWIDPDTTRLKQ